MDRRTFEGALLGGSWELEFAADIDADCDSIWHREGWSLSVGDDAVYLVRDGGRVHYEFVDKGGWEPQTRYMRAWRAVLSVQVLDRVDAVWLS